jgi:peptidoglycan hydrolase-like protein with peptidoglycan-binding domain
MKEQQPMTASAKRLLLILFLLGLSGCDYWPPSLHSQIEALRTELNDVLDERQQLALENDGLRGEQASMQREVEDKARENEELRHRLTTLSTARALSVVPSHAPQLSFNRLSSTPLALYVPARGPRVAQLQRQLRQHGRPIHIDGIYGRSTEDAVRWFQRTSRLPADGVAGPATFAALRKYERTPRHVRQLWLQRPPLKGQDVRHVQHALRRAGHRVTVDGRFGPETDIVVTRFQQRHGLEPDGMVGPRTWAVLMGKR